MDKHAEFIYVPFNQVSEKAKELNAIPFDIPNVEFTHYNDQCTFDYIVKKYEINDPAVLIIANIVRGADTDRHDIAKQSAGLWARGLPITLQTIINSCKQECLFMMLYIVGQHIYTNKNIYKIIHLKTYYTMFTLNF